MSLLLALTGAANGVNYGVRSLGSISGITWSIPLATSMQASQGAVTGSSADLTAVNLPASGSAVTYRRLGSIDITAWTGGVLKKSMAVLADGSALPGSNAGLTTAISLNATASASPSSAAGLTTTAGAALVGVSFSYRGMGSLTAFSWMADGLPYLMTANGSASPSSTAGLSVSAKLVADGSARPGSSASLTATGAGYSAGVLFSYRSLGSWAPTAWMADGLPTIALTASGAASPSSSAALVVGIGLVASGAAKPASAAGLSTAIPLVASGAAKPSGAATVYAGSIAPGVAMSYRGLGSLTATMWTGDGVPATWIIADGAAKPAGIGALGSTIALASANAARPSSSALLAVPGGLATASGAARPSGSADLTTSVALVAAKAAATQATADLLGVIRLSSSTAALASGSADLGTRIAMVADNAAFCVSTANLTAALLTDIRAHGQANPSGQATLFDALRVNPCRVIYGESLLRAVSGEPIVREVIGTCCTNEE